MTVNTYSPNDVVLSIGEYIVTGWNTITVTRSDVTKMVRGIRGQNTRSVSLDTSCTISIELLQTSTSNDVLSEIVDQDRIKQTGRLELQIKDTSGRSVLQSVNAYISNFPDISYGAEIGTRTWIIQCLNASYEVKGNETPLLQTLLNVFK